MKLFLIDIGDCPFCGDKVFAAEGESVPHMNGDPTHKQCRTEFGVDESIIPK